jgi:hypothetical protein
MKEETKTIACEFINWMRDKGWYEAANMKYDNYNKPDHIRLSIEKLFDIFIKDKGL